MWQCCIQGSSKVCFATRRKANPGSKDNGSWFDNHTNCFSATYYTMIMQDCDVAAASEKLAACQETIVNLGKKLKALASPQDAPLFDKVISTPAAAKSKRRLQLVDHMRAEDEVTLQSPNTKEIICTELLKPPTAAASKNQHSHEGSAKCIMNLSPVKSPISNHRGGTTAERLMIVPKKQKGGGMFLRKLLLRRKRER